MSTLLARAREIADEVLFPAALEVDAADRVPPSHLDLLAAEGFYGLAARPDVDHATLAAVVAALASGCLTTTFVWMQHHTPVQALAGTPFQAALASGERRAGIGLAGIRTADPLTVRRDGDALVLDGTIPWVTGWDMIDCLWIAARDGSSVRFLLIDAVAGPTLTASLQDLSAVRASRTVNLTATGHVVPASCLVRSQPYDEWAAGDSSGSATNGFLSIGLVDRCVALLRAVDRVPAAAGLAESLAADAVSCREALLDGPSPPGRAAASALAWRGAGMVAAVTGARAVLTSSHAQRLGREALFLQVFGSRPAIRDALLTLL